ncbi:MAG TPA: ABC-three component system protein [Xanthobacteraceae bacterium]
MGSPALGRGFTVATDRVRFLSALRARMSNRRTLSRDYRLYELSDAEFEDVVVRICVRWLGQGVTPFAPGRDGGRDAKFHGTATCFPSATSPHAGHFVIQAKHVNERDRSCSDREFLRVLKGEYSKIKRLVAEQICNHYIVFTNRRLPGGADERLIKELMALNLRSAFIVGVERCHMALDEYPAIRDLLPNRDDAVPFRFNPEELKEVIGAFHDYVDDGAERAFDSARDFEKIRLKNEKNRINGLSENYYQEIIVADSMPHFDKIDRFLKNPAMPRWQHCITMLRTN